MTGSSRVRVYMACSLDGSIAGPGDDLSFLHDPALAPAEGDPPTGALQFEDFFTFRLSLLRDLLNR